MIKIIYCEELPQWIIESDRAAYHPYSNTIYIRNDQKFIVLIHELTHYILHKIGFKFGSFLQKSVDKYFKV